MMYILWHLHCTAVSVVTLGFKELRYFQFMVDLKLINKHLTLETVYSLLFAGIQGFIVEIG